MPEDAWQSDIKIEVAFGLGDGPADGKRSQAAAGFRRRLRRLTE